MRSILKSERKQVILEEINHHQVVSLDSLVRLLNTSESTVRRDLDELEDERKLRRIHGDAGTTNELLINELSSKHMTVVTNSIHHATKLVEKNIPTVIIGGVVKSSTDASIGGVALNQIGQLNFNKAFIGMNGIDENFYTTPDMEEGAVKRAILENAKQTYILADASKIGQTSFVKVAPIKRASIITSACANEQLEKIKEKTEVIEV